MLDETCLRDLYLSICCLRECCLCNTRLNRITTLVREARTNRHDLAAHLGLLTLVPGVSRLYRDDLQKRQAGLLICDAGYRRAIDATTEQQNGRHATAGANL